MGVVVLALIGAVADLFAAWRSLGPTRWISIWVCAWLGDPDRAGRADPRPGVLGIGHPMSLVFDSPLDLFAIAGAAVIVRAIVDDGETNWYEGFFLIGYTFCLRWRFFSKGRRDRYS